MEQKTGLRICPTSHAEKINQIKHIFPDRLSEFLWARCGQRWSFNRIEKLVQRFPRSHSDQLRFPSAAGCRTESALAPSHVTSKAISAQTSGIAAGCNVRRHSA